MPAEAILPQPASLANSRGPKSRAGLKQACVNGAITEITADPDVLVERIVNRARETSADVGLGKQRLKPLRCFRCQLDVLAVRHGVADRFRRRSCAQGLRDYRLHRR